MSRRALERELGTLMAKHGVERVCHAFVEYCHQQTKQAETAVGDWQLLCRLLTACEVQARNVALWSKRQPGRDPEDL